MSKKSSKWKPDDLARFVARQNQAGGALSNAKPQHHEAPTLGGTAQGTTEGVQRVVVRFTGYRVQPLDPDNFAGSCKDLLDGLRHAGLISGDEPWRIRYQTEQERVAHYAEERTEIEIEYPKKLFC